jgi:hypothetical protein
VKKKVVVTVVISFLVLMLSAKPISADMFGFDTAVLFKILFQSIEEVSTLHKQYDQLTQTYGLLTSQYAALKDFLPRYESQFMTWARSWSPSHYNNTGEMVNVFNSGSNPTGAYGSLTTSLQVYPGSLGVSSDELTRIRQTAGRIDVRDGTVQQLLQTVGLMRQNNQQVEQQISNLNADILSDGQDSMAVEQRQATAQVLMLQSQRDAANLQLQVAQLAALQATEEREEQVQNANDVLWLHQTVGASAQASVANQGAELQAWSLNQ